MVRYFTTPIQYSAVNKAVFLDKDGTLIRDIPYNVDPALITLSPYAPEALLHLQQQGYALFVVSNQPGIALGYFSEADVQRAFLAICKMLRRHGVRLDGFYYCPHDVNGKQWPYVTSCQCRKPRPGMLQKAAAEHAIDLGNSWMIGDILHDVEAGNRAGCKTILLNNGNETEWDLQDKRIPSHTVGNLWEAADFIVKQEKYSHRVGQL
jgi:D-glycero-D-manno-heptose 1,7-bisphosphate phosphatase